MIELNSTHSSVSESTPVAGSETSGPSSTVVATFRTIMANVLAATPEIRTRLFEDATPLSVKTGQPTAASSDVVRLADYCPTPEPSSANTIVRDEPPSTVAAQITSPTTQTSASTTYSTVHSTSCSISTSISISKAPVVSTTAVTSATTTTTAVLSLTPSITEARTPVHFDNESFRPAPVAQPVYNKDPENENEKDVTTTRQQVVDEDMRYLFEAVGQLLEQSKVSQQYTKEIPELLNSLKTFKAEIRGELADLSGRVLSVEEETKQLKEQLKELKDTNSCIRTFLFTKEGQSITMHNKSRISALEDNVKAIDVSLKSLHTQRDGDPSETIPYTGWDESRILSIEDHIEQLQQIHFSTPQPSQNQPSEQREQQHLPPRHSIEQQQLQQFEQQPNNNNTTTNNNSYGEDSSDDENPQTTNNNNSNRGRNPKSYKDKKVSSKTLLLTDSNGRCIDPKRFIPKDKDVQRFTCYTLKDVVTFTKEVAIEKQPVKVLLQVGTNTLTQVKSPAEVSDLMSNTIKLLGTVFPAARIYVSSLLPRKDNLNKAVTEINNYLEDYCDALKKVSFVNHVNISKAELVDRLHIDTRGFYKFLCNFRYSMFGLLPSSNRRGNNRGNNRGR